MIKEKLLKVNGSLLLKYCVKNKSPTFSNLCEAIHHSEYSPDKEVTAEENETNYKEVIRNYAVTKIQSFLRQLSAKKRVRKIKLVLKKIKLI
jgi:hypothetical protein